METTALVKKFKDLFDKEAIVVRAPGRVNLIGEHTDYNEGFVLPAAIDKEIVFAIAPNDLHKIRLYSIDLTESFEIDIDNIKPTDTMWANYLIGVAKQMQKGGYALRGVDCVFGGDIPLGAGLSSSAAIECGFAFGLNTIFDFNIQQFDLVKMAQMAEHEFAGVKCGIMDQFASMFGKNNHVIKLDCRNHAYRYFNLDLSQHRIVLCDTMVKHSLASSEYNTRRSECEEGVAILKKYDNTINSLRDVSLSLLDEHKSELNPTVYKRCSYVIKENLRVEAACEALENKDYKKFGEYMYLSHEGLRDNYAVSCKELDFLVDLAKESDGVLGSRMMGGGFGGCTINLVQLDKVERFTSKVNAAYTKEMGKSPKIYIAKIEDGTGCFEEEQLLGSQPKVASPSFL